MMFVLSCLILCDPMDCGLLGSSAHGILQTRILEWLPFPPSEDLPDHTSGPCLLHWHVDSAELPGKPILNDTTSQIL